MPKQLICEALPTTQQATPNKSGRLEVTLITPGWGSSGYYSASVLKAAAEAGIWKAGHQMFADHPGENEAYDRPERTIRDLAATLTETARWDADGERVVAEAQVFPHMLELLTDEHFAKSIGVSIRAYAESRHGEAEGRKGQLVTRIDEAISTDFVTRAGRGGAIAQVMESARPSQVVERAVTRGVAEATANDIRSALSNVITTAYGGEKVWTWLRDFDEDRAWFSIETPDGAAIYEQAYVTDNDGIPTDLDGDAIEVRAHTEYVPVKPAAESSGSEATGSTDQTTNVPAPAGQSTATESEETHMATTQIEESRLAQLEKDSERVQSLESERNADRTALAEAHRLIDNAEARTIVRTAAREADIRLNDFEVAGIAADYPKGEDGRIDKDKLAESAKAAVATLAESRGAGSITGFGSTAATVSSDVVAEAEQASAAAFGRTITKEA